MLAKDEAQWPANTSQRIECAKILHREEEKVSKQSLHLHHHNVGSRGKFKCYLIIMS